MEKGLRFDSLELFSFSEALDGRYVQRGLLFRSLREMFHQIMADTVEDGDVVLYVDTLKELRKACEKENPKVYAPLLERLSEAELLMEIRYRQYVMRKFPTL